MAMLADFMAMIVAAYVLLRCFDIAFRWAETAFRNTIYEGAVRIVGAVILIILATATFIWTAYWFFGMLNAVSELAKALGNLK